MAPFGPAPRNGFKADIFELAGFIAKVFQLLACCAYFINTIRDIFLQPAQKTTNRSAVANMRGACALDLDLVLDGFGQRCKGSFA